MRVALVAALLAPAACGAGERDSGGPEDEAGRSEPEETVYQGVLTVLENEEHGPQLTAVVAQSYPPQGGTRRPRAPVGACTSSPASSTARPSN
jgi:hypothetical protein